MSFRDVIDQEPWHGQFAFSRATPTRRGLTEDLGLFVRPDVANGQRIVSALRATGRTQDIADAEFLERLES
jgi:hypothetical protein